MGFLIRNGCMPHITPRKHGVGGGAETFQRNRSSIRSFCKRAEQNNQNTFAWFVQRFLWITFRFLDFISDDFYSYSGAGESGKSTLVKQMKIIHSCGFSHTERTAFRPTMLDNLLASMKYVLTGMGRLRINLQDPNNKVRTYSFL